MATPVFTVSMYVPYYRIPLGSVGRNRQNDSHKIVSLQLELSANQTSMDTFRFLSSHQGSPSTGSDLFNIAIAVIFAREVLEGSVIYGNYRTVILKNQEWDAETKNKALQAVNRSTLFAVTLGLIVVTAVAVPLGILSRNLKGESEGLIEGASKLVASFCIVQMSVKIPLWLGIYWKVSIFPWKNKGKTFDEEIEVLSLKEIWFNVVWNIWREVAECGVFLIPFFLGTGAKAIPISAVVGIAISLCLGVGIYIANHRLKDRSWLAVFMAGLTLFLSVGMFVGGCDEFQEVFGDTKTVYSIERQGWSDSSFPMVILVPFGYSSHRTVLQFLAFWLFLVFGLGLHFLKWRNTQIAKVLHAAQKAAAPKELPMKDLESQHEDDIDVSSQSLEKELSGKDTLCEETLEKGRMNLIDNNDDAVVKE